MSEPILIGLSLTFLAEKTTLFFRASENCFFAVSGNTPPTITRISYRRRGKEKGGEEVRVEGIIGV